MGEVVDDTKTIRQLVQALRDMTPKIPDDRKDDEDCACLTVLIPLEQIRAANEILSKYIDMGL